MLEAILAGIIIALLGGAITLSRAVYRLIGVVENGLIDNVADIKSEQKDMQSNQGVIREEQARQGARIDAIYKLISVGD